MACRVERGNATPHRFVLSTSWRASCSLPPRYPPPAMWCCRAAVGATYGVALEGANRAATVVRATLVQASPGPAPSR